MADDVEVRFGANISNLVANVAQIRESLQGLVSPIRSVGDNLAVLGKLFIATFAIKQVGDLIQRFADLGDQTERAAAILGTATENIAGIALLAKSTGGSIEELSMGFARLGMSLARAGAGSDQAQAALRALGVSANELQTLPIQQKLELLADKFARLKDGGDKNTIAMALMGRSATTLIPIFNQGAEGVRKFAEMAERAGSAMTGEQLAAADRLDDGLLELGAAFTGAGNSIMTAFQPALSGAIRLITDLVEKFTQSVNQGGAMKVMLETLATALKVVDVALIIAVGAVETLWNVTKDVVFAMGEGFFALARIIKDVFTFNWSDVGAAWDNLQNKLTARAKISAGNMEKIFGGMVGQLKTVFQGAADEQVKIQQTTDARLKLINRDAVSAHMAEIDGEIRALRAGLEQKKIILEGEAESHRVTQDQKYAALLRETDLEYQAELALLQKKMQIGGMTVADRQKVLNEIKELESRHTTDMLRLSEQSIAAQRRNWEEYLGTITSAFNGQLRGLLQGTTTWGQAVKAMLLDLTVAFIQMVENWVIKWIAGEIARTTATTAGVAVRAGAEQAGQATGLITMIAGVIKSIMASVGQVFAGVTAFLAPVMGPAAPAAGAAVAGSVAAGAMAMVPSSAVGGLVLSDGLVSLHAGNVVTPAKMAQPFDPAMMGGKSAAPEGRAKEAHAHFNVTAMDAADVRRFFRRNARQIMEGLNEAARNGSHLGLSKVGA